MDSDYKNKLSDDDREWLEKFESEYYRCSFTQEPLHNAEQKKELYRRQWTASNDVVTQIASRIIKCLITAAKPSRHTYYVPEDYKFFEEEP